MSNKKKVIKKVLNKLTEAPIDYGDRPERMSPDIERQLAGKETTFSDHPAMPEVDPEGIPSDYPEFMASKRFKDVIQDVIRFTGLRNVPTEGRNSIMTLQRILMEAVYTILELEDGHREELENLAVNLVKQEFGIGDDYQWDVKILDIRQQQQADEMQNKIQEMNEKPEEEQEEAVEEAIENLNGLELEKAKRRFMNAMVQGSAQKMNQAYYLVQNELNGINPQLLNLYGTMMAMNDLQYWILPDQTIEGKSGAGSGAGTEEIDDKTDPPTIKARGINFPTLVHEITKAVMDAIATHGLPDNPVEAQKIIQSEDTLPKETWDLRLGPIIWEKFRAAYPEQLYDEDRRRIQAHLIMEFAQLPAEEFMELAKEILSGSDEGKQRLNEIVQGILESLNKENLEDFEYQSDIEGQPSPEGKEGDEGNEKPFDPTDPSTWE
jgi:hypothetical protein